MQCLNCRKSLDAATGFDGADKPRPGNISICLCCGHVMAYADPPTSFRELNDEEMRDVAGDKTILAIQRARGKVLKAGNLP
jgi:hypothetical protein